MTDRYQDIDAALARIERHAPFLRQLAARRPEVIERLRAGGIDAAIAGAAEPGASGPELARALRRERQALALAIGAGDLAGMLPFEGVVARLSAFADRALDRAIRGVLLARGADEPTGFTALALGKHGSRELNYSSDIDPILLFDPATLPHRAKEEPVEAAVRIARAIVELLEARDRDGYVLRVDLRLRPSPEATPLALPIDAAIAYYESSALPWERAAFVRARAAAGDLALGRDFLQAIRPFVWRRGLGFGAVGEIREITGRIRAHYKRGQALGPGYDVKRGRGGIREIEFFAQIHQLIHGGREPALRAPATLDALAALAEARRIGADEARTLSSAYRLLRTVEHRLQMVDDQQTHRLPEQPDALDNVARLGGWADGAALIATLGPHVEAVARIWDTLDPGPAGAMPVAEPDLASALSAAGFPDPEQARRRIERWRGGAIRAVRTPAAHAALEAMLPRLIAALGRAADPMAALARFDALLGGLPTAIDLFRLLEANPALATLLGDILAHAPALGTALGRQPALLDGLIDASGLAPAPPLDALIAELGRSEAGDDYQALLDHVRRRVGERRFALGAQIIAGTTDPRAAAAGYARLAEAALTVLADATIAEFERAHGGVPGGGLVILGLGRLGGRALTNASDLDLIYLFAGDYRTESDGARPLGATLYFNRLATRVTAALSAPTAAGPLYAVDTRLRPSGADGLLAVSIESFAAYQRDSAWTWEHMALARARTVYGAPEARAELARIIADTLTRPRDPARVRADAATMRAEMGRHKPPAGAWDVKLIAGGLVDLEFAVHVLQLTTGQGLAPQLDRAVAALAGAGLIAPGLVDAETLLTRLLVTLRLVAPEGGAPPEASQALVARACGLGGWAELETRYAAARGAIAGELARVLAGGSRVDALVTPSP